MGREIAMKKLLFIALLLTSCTTSDKKQKHFFAGCFISSQLHIEAAGFKFDDKVQHITTKFCIDIYSLYSKRI